MRALAMIVAVSGLFLATEAHAQAAALGSPSADAEVPSPTEGPSLERRYPGGGLVVGSLLSTGAVASAIGGIVMLVTSTCDADDFLCLGEPLGGMFVGVGGALAFAAMIVFGVTAARWSEVDEHNRRVRERGGAFFDARGVGLRF